MMLPSRSVHCSCNKTFYPVRPSLRVSVLSSPNRRLQLPLGSKKIPSLICSAANNRIDDPPINEAIRVPEVRLLDEDKTMLGVYPISVALQQAMVKSVDLVLISETASPPLCRLMEVSKYKYELEKAAKEARRKQRASRVDVKELKMRPSTDVADYNVRLRKAVKEIGKANHVKVVITFKGREFNFKEKGREMLEKFQADLGDAVQVERPIRMEGRIMTMTLSPKR